MNFFERLKAGNFMGTVYEAGLGVPFVNYLTSLDGCSEVLFIGNCPYNKLPQQGVFQVMGTPGLRSVSEQAVIKMAEFQWQSFSDAIAEQGKTPFTVSVSGSYKKPDERGESHGWICVRTKHFTNTCHFRIPPDCSRVEAIDYTLHVIKWFLTQTLLRGNGDWTRALEEYGEYGINGECPIDVINAPGASTKDLLNLCKRDNPLLFSNDGRMIRAVDIIRLPIPWLRGSFNPMTLRHTSMADAVDPSGSCLELSLTNARKGSPDPEDIAHRIRMANVGGRGIMVTMGCPTFVEFDALLASLGAPEERQYAMGADTYNAVVSPEWCPGDDFLAPLKRAQITVFTRPDCPLQHTKNSDHLNLTVNNETVLAEASSTNSRETLENLDPRVLQYIKDYGLYGH